MPHKIRKQNKPLAIFTALIHLCCAFLSCLQGMKAEWSKFTCLWADKGGFNRAEPACMCCWLAVSAHTDMVQSCLCLVYVNYLSGAVAAWRGQIYFAPERLSKKGSLLSVTVWKNAWKRWPTYCELSKKKKKRTAGCWLNLNELKKKGYFSFILSIKHF